MSVGITTTAGNGCILVTPANSAASAVNTLWRANERETGGAFIRLSTALAYNETFSDYNAASGQEYIYKLTENVAGTLTDSPTASGSVTLHSAWLHAASRTKRANNARYTPFQLIDQPPHNEDSAFASTERRFASLNKIDLAMSNVESFTWQLTHLVRASEYGERMRLRRLFNLNTYFCLRDALGNKEFGRLALYSENYEFNTIINFELSRVAYQEGI